MKPIIVSVFGVLLSFSSYSQATRDTVPAFSNILTNFEFGINSNFGEGGVGLGVYLEPKYVDDNFNEFGLLFSYNNFGGLRTNYRNDKVASIFANLKKRGRSKKVGGYVGVGTGLLMITEGGQKAVIGDQGTPNSFRIGIGILIDLGIYIGNVNLGVKGALGSYNMLGLNMGVRL